MGVGSLSFTYSYRWISVRAMRTETIEYKKFNAPSEIGFLTLKSSCGQSLLCQVLGDLRRKVLAPL